MANKNAEDNTKQLIIRTAREFFAQKGFKKTQVSNITKKAGIATGTFYNYFTSKEELFLIIFTEENNNLKKSLINEVDLTGEPVEVIKELFFKFIKGMQSNSILREFFNQNTFTKIEKKTNFSADEYEVAYKLFVPLIEKWQEEGKIIKKKPEYIMAFFNSLFYVFLHQEDIGKVYFPELINDFIEYVVQGLSF